MLREEARPGIRQLAAGCVRRSRGANLAAEAIAAHQIAEREKHAGEKQHQQKKTDDVPAFEHTLARSALSSRCHSYLPAPVLLPTFAGRPTPGAPYVPEFTLFIP